MKAYRAIISTLLVLALAVTASAVLAAEAKEKEAKSDSRGVVNVNQASESQLALLPRIGPALAARIVEFRETNGEFKSPEDLILVRGIGEKTFQLMEPFVVTSGDTTLATKVRVSSLQASKSDD